MSAPSTMIRAEAGGEAEAVARLVTDAFVTQQVASLVDSLRRSDAWIDGLSFVAELGGRIVGHVLFTRALLDAPAKLVDVLVLSPLAVAPEQQGRGIGSGLMRSALAVVEQRPEPLIFLEGSPSFYPRFGFKPAESLRFCKPSLRIPDAAFMVRLQPTYEPYFTGTLVYSEPFWRHDCVGLRERLPR